jgi:DNA-binding response OmpR family regulator
MGFEVQTAANGLQALIMARRNHPDVLIVDINMPELDGLSVCGRLLGPDKKPMNVIVITASSYPETTALCESFDAFHVRKGLNLWNDVRKALVEISPSMAHRGVEEGASPSCVEWRHPRVLVVDSDRELGTFLFSRLRKRGVDVLVADDTVEAYRIARKEEPNVIILCYPTSNGDAHYFLSRLRNTHEIAVTPVFVMSEGPIGKETQSILETYVSGRRGAARFLERSLDTEDLFTALQQFCGFARNPGPEIEVGVTISNQKNT